MSGKKRWGGADGTLSFSRNGRVAYCVGFFPRIHSCSRLFFAIFPVVSEDRVLEEILSLDKSASRPLLLWRIYFWEDLESTLKPCILSKVIPGIQLSKMVAVSWPFGASRWNSQTGASIHLYTLSYHPISQVLHHLHRARTWGEVEEASGAKK